MNKTTTVYQDAIRLLFILVNGSENYLEESEPKIKGLFRGKARLYAMDFWIRYPDYFAFELIKKYEETANDKFLELANGIFDNKEPDLRRIPMIRFLFGAYEKLDNTLSILISKGLVKQDGKKKESIHLYNFFLYDKAYEIIEKASDEFEILKWYDSRSRIVNEIAGDRGGRALKECQYKQLQYAQTKLGGIIPSIKDDVQDKIIQLKGLKKVQ